MEEGFVERFGRLLVAALFYGAVCPLMLVGIALEADGGE